MSRDQKKPRLGRGLSGLIADSTVLSGVGKYEGMAQEVVAPLSLSPNLPLSGVEKIPLSQIRPNPQQPRRSFDVESLAGLAESIRIHGLLQPLLVRELDDSLIPGDIRYELIVGERRFRASELAGLAEVPCIVRQASRQGMLELALIENIHRSDLNPIERAGAYRDLMDGFSLTQQDVAERMGEARASIANYLRLQELCDDVQALVAGGQLSFGHGKVLAGFIGRPEVQKALAERVIKEGWSVRRLEQAAEETKEARPSIQGQTPNIRPPYLEDMERQLSEALGTRVFVRPGRRKHSGRIMIDYYNLEDFDRVVEALGIKIDS